MEQVISSLAEAVAVANELNAVFLEVSQAVDVETFDQAKERFDIICGGIRNALRHTDGLVNSFLMGLDSHAESLSREFAEMRANVQGFDMVTVTVRADGTVLLASDLVRAWESGSLPDDIAEEFKDGFPTLSGFMNRETGELTLA